MVSVAEWCGDVDHENKISKFIYSYGKGSKQRRNLRSFDWLMGFNNKKCRQVEGCN